MVLDTFRTFVKDSYLNRTMILRHIQYLLDFISEHDIRKITIHTLHVPINGAHTPIDIEVVSRIKKQPRIEDLNVIKVQNILGKELKEDSPDQPYIINDEMLKTFINYTIDTYSYSIKNGKRYSREEKEAIDFEFNKQNFEVNFTYKDLAGCFYNYVITRDYNG